MSEAMHPIGADGDVGEARNAGEPGEAAPDSPTARASASEPVAQARAAGREEQAPATAKGARRPGLVTFAAIMLFLEGGFSVVWAIVDFTQPQWLLNVYTAYGFTAPSSTAWAWGFVDLLVGAVAIFAGFSVLRGGAFAQLIGICVVSFSALRWFFFLPFVPVVAVLFIALDVLVIYGLATHSEYFATFDTGPLFGGTQEEPST